MLVDKNMSVAVKLGPPVWFIVLVAVVLLSSVGIVVYYFLKKYKK